MRLKHVTGAKLTLDSGETVMLEKLGKGMFHTCYVDPTAKQVYSVTINRADIDAEDYSKEILSHCDENPHIPRVQFLGSMDERRVYRMPLYRPIRAKEHPEAHRLLKLLIDCRQEAWYSTVRELVSPRKMRITDIGYIVNEKVAEHLDGCASVPVELREAIQELISHSSAHGSSYCFEFSRRNVMVDDNGTLILLDVLFNLETVEEIRNNQMKKASNRW